MQKLATPAFILLIIASIGILLSRDWRIVIGLFAAQYLGVLILVGVNWTFGMACVKLIIGWMAGTVIGTTQIGKKAQDKNISWPAERVFRLLASILGVLLVFSLAPKLAEWLPGGSLPVAQGGLVLIIIGLLQLGMTSRPLRVIIGLLTVLAGFEILYATVEDSLLVAGLLGGANMGLAMLGSYFISIDTPEEPV